MNLNSWLRTKRRRLRGGWNRFWFRAQDPTLVGLMRIVTGLMLIYSHMVWGISLFDFFGQDAWVPPHLIRELQGTDFHFSYLWWIDDQWLPIVHGCGFFLLAAFACGYKTRVTSILAVVIHVSYARRQPAATFGLDQVLGFLSLYLAYGFFFTPVRQRALSVDRWLWLRNNDAARSSARALEPSRGANLTLRLIQVQMCVVYLFAGMSKLQGESWWNGEAMWLALSNEEYANSLSMMWTVHFPATLAFAGHLIVIWELLFASLVWNRGLRPYVLAVGLAMHLGIGLFLSMWTFAIMMIVGCCSFLSTEWVATVLRGKQQLEQAANESESGADAKRRRAMEVATPKPKEDKCDEPEPVKVAAAIAGSGETAPDEQKRLQQPRSQPSAHGLRSKKPR